MGRVKTMKIKRATKEIFSRHADEVSANFSENKEKLKNMAAFESKKIRNIVAGYLTRLAKIKEKL